MKKIFFWVLFMLVELFVLTGCTEKIEEDINPSNLKEVTGRVVKATVNDDGYIVIEKDEITEQATYITYEYEDVIIGLMAVRDSKGDVKVVINTCQSCGGSPHAYFVQVGDRIQCQNCGSTFAIDDLGELVVDGCNPIAVRNLKETQKEIIIETQQLIELKDKFENWQGPKA